MRAPRGQAFQWRKRLSIAFAGLCLAGFALPWLGAMRPAPVGLAGWTIDLAAHWQWACSVLWIALCLLSARRRRRWLAALPLALLPLWTASPALPAARDDAVPTLVIASANVQAGNPDPAPLARWLRTQSVDVVVLVELAPAYADGLQRALADRYPHHAFFAADSPFGIGLLSRLPLREVARTDSADGIPSLAATVDTAQGPVRVVAAHPMPPLAPHWQQARDDLLRTLAHDAQVRPTVVAGDLNATPWSRALAHAADLGLRRATGLAPTWPSAHVGIPIDHVLAGPGWRRGDTARGPDIGSDHRPIRAVLFLDPVPPPVPRRPAQ
ncbi:MAG: endonuclease/exonuclease/phosphatase family protein [Lysobacteraceae bacterium]